MLARSWFILIGVFFVWMNFLLWQSEVRGRGQLGSPIPLDVVWRKILTAPDDSTLELRRRGQRIGLVHWIPNVGEELATGKVGSEDLPPEGMVRQVSGYSIDIDGSMIEVGESNLRFHTRLEFATNHTWKRFNLRVSLNPTVYHVDADAVREEIGLRVEADQETLIRRSWRFSELRDPRQLLRQLGGPLGDIIAQFDLIPSLGQEPSAPDLSFKLDWEARNDWMTLGNARLRVYRLHVRALDQFEAVVFVSPVGEILRAELPGEIVLLNDAFTTL